MSIAYISQVFFQILTSLKIYHWKTLKYSRHVASGNLESELNNLFDKFIETLQGYNNQRINFTTELSLKLENQDDDSIIELLNDFKNWLIEKLPSYLQPNPKHSDLLNIRDEILGHINQTLYLFTLQ